MGLRIQAEIGFTVLTRYLRHSEWDESVPRKFNATEEVRGSLHAGGFLSWLTAMLFVGSNVLGCDIFPFFPVLLVFESVSTSLLFFNGALQLRPTQKTNSSFSL